MLLSGSSPASAITCSSPCQKARRLAEPSSTVNHTPEASASACWPAQSATATVLPLPAGARTTTSGASVDRAAEMRARDTVAGGTRGVA